MSVDRICGSIPTSASSTLLAEDTDMGDDDYDMEGEQPHVISTPILRNVDCLCLLIPALSSPACTRGCGRGGGGDPAPAPTARSRHRPWILASALPPQQPLSLPDLRRAIGPQQTQSITATLPTIARWITPEIRRLQVQTNHMLRVVVLNINCNFALFVMHGSWFKSIASEERKFR